MWRNVKTWWRQRKMLAHWGRVQNPPSRGRTAPPVIGNPGVPLSPWWPSFHSRVIASQKPTWAASLFIHKCQNCLVSGLIQSPPSSRSPQLHSCTFITPGWRSSKSAIFNNAPFPVCLSPSEKDKINRLLLRIYGTSAQSKWLTISFTCRLFLFLVISC